MKISKTVLESYFGFPRRSDKITEPLQHCVEKSIIDEVIQNNHNGNIQTNISKQSIRVFSDYFTGFDDFFLNVVNGVYSINSCIIEIKGLYDYTITENEFLQLLITKKKHYKAEFITNFKS
ncbi:MAG: hypothetical protein A2046_12315 [Bacteroidetes bacterium GWA2_30_7]|nr:MAG: hypothetical protein A2046_12315 [Bacteroidetes bacterium GWA2_30_7]